MPASACAQQYNLLCYQFRITLTIAMIIIFAYWYMIPFNVNNSSKHASRTVDTKRLFQTTVGYTAWDTVQEHRSIGLYSINGWGREITIIPTSSPWLGWWVFWTNIPVLCNRLLGCIGCYFFVYQSKVIVYWAVFTWILGVASKQL